MCVRGWRQVELAGLDGDMVALGRKQARLQATLARQQGLSCQLAQVGSVARWYCPPD